MTVADVYINIPVKSIARAFTYIVPETLMQIGAGWRVLVPFGEVQVEGFVVETRPCGMEGTIYGRFMEPSMRRHGSRLRCLPRHRHWQNFICVRRQR